ncbi:MAG: L,D-transpeptidase family protein [Saprospiraceae bacterium]|nr:L,D-transpeptidase family protein [Saprospiraceae bacterium]
MSQELNNLLDPADDTVLYPILKTLIENEEYPFLLTSKNGLKNIDSIQKILTEAHNHGFYNRLAPRLEQIQFLKEQIDSTFQIRSKDSTSHLLLAKLEKETLLAALAYHKTMNYGAVNPKTTFLSGYHLPVILPDSSYYNEFFSSKEKLTLLNEAYPSHPKYKALQEYYTNWNTQSHDDWKALPNLTVKKMEPNKKYRMVPLLRERFGLQPIIDSVDGKAVPNIVYDAEVVQQVKTFQANHGLKPDGIIGPATHAALNTSPEERTEQIRATLERFRWQLNTNKSDYILVNIPDYNLVYYEKGKALDTIIVVVGKKHPKNYYNFTAKDRPKYVRNYETPEFMDTMETVVINPKWNVPKSISTLEILPNVQANPYYLLENNYRVFYGREEQPRDSVDWWMYTPEDFPYRIVQDPGAGNALGKIKFLFPNKHSVYLHDTPSKSYFYVDNRAQSHGCVRVREPDRLGALILKDNPIYKEFKDTDEYKIINVPERMQVTITYYTTWVDQKGVLQVRKDVYGKDKELIDALSSVAEDQLLAAVS